MLLSTLPPVEVIVKSTFGNKLRLKALPSLVINVNSTSYESITLSAVAVKYSQLPSLSTLTSDGFSSLLFALFPNQL